MIQAAYLLLLHELRVWAIVDDISSEDWGCEAGIDLLSVDILQLSVEDEFVALSTDVDSGLLAKQDESEDVAVLLPVLLKEAVRVHAISDGIANNWQPVEDERRLIWVLEEQLAQDVKDDGESDEGGKCSEADGSKTTLGDLGLERGEDSPGNILNDTHSVVVRSLQRARRQLLCG